MEDIRFQSRDEFWQFIYSLEKLKTQGIQGVVYRKDGLLIKDFGEDTTLKVDRTLAFRDMETRDIYFPKAGIYVGKKLRATISEYAEGHSLSETKLYCERISLIIDAISRLEKAIESLSSEKIKMSDMNPGNILFDEDHFNIIDTVEYRRLHFGSKDHIEYANKIYTFWTIFHGIIPQSLYNYFYRKGYFAGGALSDPQECLYKIYRELRSIIGGDFQSLMEANKALDDQKIILNDRLRRGKL